MGCAVFEGKFLKFDYTQDQSPATQGELDFYQVKYSRYTNLVRLFFVGFFRWLNSLLHRPARVLWFCLGLAFINLVVDGSLLRLWGMHRDFASIQSKIKTLAQQSADLESKLAKTSDPAFIEREAIDRLDMVNDRDLVFVFSDEE